METLTQLARPTDATRAQWRMALVQAHTTQDWPMALSVLGAMARAGVDLERDPEEVAPELGAPDYRGGEWEFDFCEGYERTLKRRLWDDNGDGNKAEREGAEYCRSVRTALEWAMARLDAGKVDGVAA